MSTSIRHRRLYLQDMRDYANSAAEFVVSRTEKDFETDLMLQFAVIRALEVIGEAARQFQVRVPDAEKRFPQIPFRAVYAMRNFLIHGYTTLNLENIWRVTTQEIPPLLTALDSALANWPSDLADRT
jgi:uncharacterized protein with HEPN domain